MAQTINFSDVVKAQKEQQINLIWRTMVGGFQRVNPYLAKSWGVHQPSGYVADNGNTGLVMFCERKHLSVIVEHDQTNDRYTLSVKHDNKEQQDTIANGIALEAIPELIINTLK